MPRLSLPHRSRRPCNRPDDTFLVGYRGRIKSTFPTISSPLSQEMVEQPIVADPLD